MDKLDMKSKDIFDSNITSIIKLFPNCVSEGKINFELLKQELSNDIIEGKEKYELTWPGKRQAIVEGNTRTTKTLRPLKDKSVDFDNSCKEIFLAVGII